MIVLQDDWTVESIKRDYALITEGEIDALSLESAGYPAISTKGSSRLPLAEMLSLVDRVYIVQDRDEDKVNKKGETYNPGQIHAERLAKYVNEGRTREAKIIMPPEGYKDANDLARAGLLEGWLSQYKVRPTLNAAQSGFRTVAPMPRKTKG